ncbi:MAG: hypothetical protein AB7F89_24025, partial [Pirellulaceae bacterium]
MTRTAYRGVGIGAHMAPGFLSAAIYLVAGWISGAGMVARADLIAAWDFNDSNLAVDHGLGILSVRFPAADISFAAGTTRNATAGVPAGQGLALRNQANNGTGTIDLAINAADHTNLVLSLATQKTSTGFSSNQVLYSTDGGAIFHPFGSVYNPPASYDVVSFDFTGIGALDHNPQAIFRIQFGGATSATGNNRLDNIQIQGTFDPVSTPEPPVWLALLAGAAGWGWRHPLRR